MIKVFVFLSILLVFVSCESEDPIVEDMTPETQHEIVPILDKPKSNKTLTPGDPFIQVLANNFSDGFAFDMLHVYVHGELIHPESFLDEDVGDWAGMQEEGRPIYEILCGRPVEVRLKLRHNMGYNFSGFKITAIGFGDGLGIVPGITDDEGIASVIIEHLPHDHCEEFEVREYDILIYPVIDKVDIYQCIPNIDVKKNKDNANPNVILVRLLFKA